MAGVAIIAERGHDESWKTQRRWLMGWEDWLTLVPALFIYMALAVSVRDADLVNDLPSLVPTVLGGLLVGMVATRVRVAWWIGVPVGLALGAFVVVLGVLPYANGENVWERWTDLRLRLWDWWVVVRDGGSSNDDAPFVTLVHALAFVAAFVAAVAIYRLRNAWLAVIPAGVGLLVTIAARDGQPGATFVFFLFGALVLVSRMYLQRRQRAWEKEHVEYPDFISLRVAQVVVTMAIGLIVLAWLVPLGKQADAADRVIDRVTSPITDRADTWSRLFPGVDFTSGGGNFHKFGNTLPLRGDVSLGDKLLARVQVAFAEDPEGLAFLQFVRATSYDEYTGSGWRSTDRETADVRPEDATGTLNGLPIYEGFEPPNYALREPTLLNVTVFDDEDTLFSVGPPAFTDLEGKVDTPEASTADIERLRAADDFVDGDTYVVRGSLSVAGPNDLRQASSEYPEWFSERYRQLPGGVPERVIEEAAAVVAAAGATTAYDKAVAIEEYVRDLPYDLSVDDAPPRGDLVDFVLFEAESGYFDYLATVMVVLLRAEDVPARLAVGYLLDNGDLDRDTATYDVRKNDAYAWVEVFFPEFGWVEFNPTPNLPGVSDRPNQPLDAAPPPSDLPLIPVDPFGLPLDIFGDPLLPDLDLELPDADVATAEDGGFEVPWTLLAIVGGVLAVLAATGTGGWVAWGWSFRGLSGTPRTWAQTQRWAHWARLGAERTETPREWSRRVGEAVEREEDAAVLAQAYERARYGQGEGDDEAVEAAYRSVRAGLWARITRRRRERDD